MDELNNLASAGTDSVEPHEDDNAEPTTYWDPEDDEPQDTPEDGTPEPATDEGAEEEPAEPEEPEAPKPDPVTLTLPDGTQISADEAAKGYLRQADYTRKSQELAQQRQAAQADLQRIQGITEAITDHLTSLIPPAPDTALAMTNPQAYVAQKAQHDAAVAKVRELIEVGGKPKQIQDAWTAEQRQTVLAQENADLLNASQRFRPRKAVKSSWAGRQRRRRPTVSPCKTCRE